VFVDVERGNWCEGLTTYLADSRYKEEEGEAPAREYRLKQLQGSRATSNLNHASGEGGTSRIVLRRTLPGIRD